MRKFILTVRPEPDGALDVATLARRNVPALSAPLTAPSYHALEISASGKFSGVILTSRHAVTGLCAATGGKLDDRIAGLPAFAVGRATGRAAREAAASGREAALGAREAALAVRECASRGHDAE